MTYTCHASRILPAIARITRGLICMMGIIFFSCSVFAQTTPDAEQGIKPYGAYSSGEFDSVSLINGTLDIHLPFASYSQRGGKLKLTYTIRYTSPALKLGENCIPNHGCTFYAYGNGSSPVLTQDQAIQPRAVLNSAGLVSYWTVADPDGNVHDFGNVSGSIWESIDATGMRYDATANIITDSAGTRYNYQYNNNTGIITELLEDANGNEMSMTQGTWTDTLGRTFPPPWGVATTNYSGCTGPLPIAYASTWTVPGPNGTSQTYKFCYANVSYITAGARHARITGLHGLCTVIPGVSSLEAYFLARL